MATDTNFLIAREQDAAKSFYKELLGNSQEDIIVAPVVTNDGAEPDVVTPTDIISEENLEIPDVDVNIKLAEATSPKEGDIDLDKINLSEGKASENFRKIKNAASIFKTERDNLLKQLEELKSIKTELEEKFTQAKTELDSFKGEESKLLFETNNEYLKGVDSRRDEIKLRIKSVADLHDLSDEVIEAVLSKSEYKEALSEAEEYIFDDAALRDLSVELKEYFLNEKQKSEILNGNSQAREILKKRFEEEKLRIKTDRIGKAPLAVEESFKKIIPQINSNIEENVLNIIKVDAVNWLKYFAATGVEINPELSDKFSKIIIKSYLYTHEKMKRESLEQEKSSLERELDIGFPQIGGFGTPTTKPVYVNSDGSFNEQKHAEDFFNKF
jgi:hypothetical protein